MTKVVCPSCHYSFSAKKGAWYSQAKCKKCNRIFIIDQGRRSGFVYRKYRDMVAQGIDKKTGQPFWIDTKGKRVRHDDSSIRYDVIRDPQGWKATGKKVKDPEYGKTGRR